MIRVSRRARRHEDRAGDPLDGLVNLFDLGIVLSVAFLLAALSSLNLSSALTKQGQARIPKDAITVSPQQTSGPVPPDGGQVIGQGQEIGKVYRLNDGQLVYVVPKDSEAPLPSVTPAPTPTPSP